MSFTNTTPNYGLPQYLSSDKPAWMADINVAFSDIDTQMKQNADDALAAQTTANNALLDIATGYSNLSTYSVGDKVIYQERLYICDVAVTVPEAFDNAKWSIYRVVDIADVADLAKNTADAVDSKVGSTDISGIGDGTCTGAIDELSGEISDLNDAMTANELSSAVGLVAYPESSPYITPSDGYVECHTTSSVKGYVKIEGANSNQSFMIGSEFSAGLWSTFVRKGMKISMVTGYVPYEAKFYPLS